MYCPNPNNNRPGPSGKKGTNGAPGVPGQNASLTPTPMVGSTGPAGPIGRLDSPFDSFNLSADKKNLLVSNLTGAVTTIDMFTGNTSTPIFTTVGTMFTINGGMNQITYVGTDPINLLGNYSYSSVIPYYSFSPIKSFLSSIETSIIVNGVLTDIKTYSIAPISSQQTTPFNVQSQSSNITVSFSIPLIQNDTMRLGGVYNFFDPPFPVISPTSPLLIISNISFDGIVYSQ